MGLITFKVKSGAQLAINTTNIVSIERRDNYVVILYNVSTARGFCGFFSGKLYREQYEYKSSDDAIDAFNIMCQHFSSSDQEPDETSLKSSKETP
jgi:hypothetical protein